MRTVAIIVVGAVALVAIGVYLAVTPTRRQSATAGEIPADED